MMIQLELVLSIIVYHSERKFYIHKTVNTYFFILLHSMLIAWVTLGEKEFLLTILDEQLAVLPRKLLPPWEQSSKWKELCQIQSTQDPLNG